MISSGDVDPTNRSPPDPLIRIPSCLVLDAGFNHQMQSNPGMPTSEHEYGHHQLPSPNTVRVHTCRHGADHVTAGTCIQSNMRQKSPNAGRVGRHDGDRPAGRCVRRSVRIPVRLRQVKASADASWVACSKSAERT